MTEQRKGRAGGDQATPKIICTHTNNSPLSLRRKLSPLPRVKCIGLSIRSAEMATAWGGLRDEK